MWGAGVTLVAVHGHLTAVVSPVAEPGPQGPGSLP